ncbi:MAG: NADPH-dependent FMN reductase [Alphaproteobacteria bacterium]
MHKLAIIVGSLRQGSFNRQLAEAISKLIPKEITIDWIKLDDVPIYNGDYEMNLPAPVKRLKDQIKDADAVLLVTPEYNRSIPAVLKNAIDWATRPPGTSVWGSKPVAIIGISPGAIGTAAAQQHLRNTLSAVGALTMPQPEIYVTYKEGMFSSNGEIADAKFKEILQKFIAHFIIWVTKNSKGNL